MHEHPLVNRYLNALMAAAELPGDLRRRPGTTVSGTEDRAGSSAALCYRVGEHAIIWTDPAVTNVFEPLGSVDASVENQAFETFAAGHGFSRVGSGAMKVLPSGQLDRPATPSEYHHRRLSRSDVDLVRAFTEVCDPDDVEEAALDELDDFDEVAINVLVEPSTGGIVAYASATADWHWDNGFADIGVLVHPGHRRRRLGTWVVAHTVADLLDSGHLPLYRHDLSNHGSDALSNALGFERVTTMQAWARQSEDDDKA